MTWLETFRTGLSAVRAHRLRSALTMLGILIGIAAVILTVGLGQGAQQQVRQQIDALGSNLLIVTPGSTTSSTGVRGGLGSATTLTRADAAALASPVVAPDVAGVAPTVSRSQQLTAGTSTAVTTWTSSTVGATPAWLSVRNRSVATGRFLTDRDLSTAATVAVLGPTTAGELFGQRDPVGQTVTVGTLPFTVVGVLDPAGSSAASNEDDTVLVPLSTAAQRLLGGSARDAVSTVYVEATGSDTLSAVYQEVDSELLALHGITTPADADFTVTTQQSIVSAATSVDRTLTVLLAGIAGISLLVGGIGVMNIMLVSVTERVREIGLRKALGATPSAVRRQFLVEASVLGLAGGVLGVLLGVVGARLLPHLVSQPVALSLPVAALAIAVALAIGIAFGVYPAGRAARLAPIDALRSE